jgi:AraC-like DNA-binding protein
MVCSRCKLAVKSELEKLGLHPIAVELGEVELQEAITENQKKVLIKQLQISGFEWIDDNKSKVIEKIKTLIIDLVQNKNNELNTNLSNYLSTHLHQDYNTLSHLFSKVEGKTIEKYFINQKIEKVKELLTYDELSLSEIAYRMNYSSVAYLSNQFKKVTGFSPTYFKESKVRKRQLIENI